MNYIVMDLEWNQSPDGKVHSYADVPFEIIQIGAVKLDEQFNVVSEFDRYICPRLYPRLHRKVEEILGITTAELKAAGDEFEYIIADFFEWCGDDYIFCTWGGTDLIELQRNMQHYGIELKFPKPFLFYDLQKLYSLCFSDGKTRCTLQCAVEELGIVMSGHYHSADDDAKYTAKVMQKLDFESVKAYYSVDTFRIPANKKEEIYLNFGNYGKYISRGFGSREGATLDREVRSCRCFICNKPMKRIIKWFATNAKSYYGLFCCEEHGLVKGRFKIKNTDDGRYYAIRILKCTDNDGSNVIRERKKREQEHRRLARLRAKDADKADEGQ